MPCPWPDPSSDQAPPDPAPLTAACPRDPTLPAPQQSSMPPLLGRVPWPVLLRPARQGPLPAVAAGSGIRLRDLGGAQQGGHTAALPHLRRHHSRYPHLLRRRQQPCRARPARRRPLQLLQELVLAMGLQGPGLSQALKRGPGGGCCRDTDMADRALPQQAGHTDLLGSRNAFACGSDGTEQRQPPGSVTPGSAFLPISPSTQLPEPLCPRPAMATRPPADGTGTPYSPPSATGASGSLVWPETPRCAELLPGHGEQQPPHPRAGWSQRRQHCHPRGTAGPPQPSNPSVAGSRGSALAVTRASATCSTPLTVAKHSRIGLNNRSAAALLCRGHALPRQWAGALPGTDCDFLLDAAQAVQPALTQPGRRQHLLPAEPSPLPQAPHNAQRRPCKVGTPSEQGRRDSVPRPSPKAPSPWLPLPRHRGFPCGDQGLRMP